jgi:hypothetical protein
MRIRIGKRTHESGSVLMVALVTTLVVGISLASYLVLMQYQSRMVDRGQAWNRALTLAEAGVEDGLAQLNRRFGTNNARGGANGWIGPVYGPANLDAPRTLLGGSYTAAISDGLPVISATGHVAIANSSDFVERRVRVHTATQPLFRAAMSAWHDINFSGNGLRVDSYDSGNPNYCSPTGTYDPLKAKAGGDIASIGGFINVANADIKGKLYTGPLNSGQYLVGANGSVGDLNWSGPGIEPGWYFDDFNMDFATVDEPYTSGLPPASQGTNIWFLGDGQYMYSGNFAGNSSQAIYVAGQATVYVTGTFDMKGPITVAPGGSLKIYVAGSYGRLNQVNTDGNAFSFQYYGLPTNSSLSWSGNSTFTGTVYAPQASLKLSGGGSSTLDFQGAIIADTISLNGHFSFHFDENLRRRGPMSGFMVTLWEED